MADDWRVYTLDLDGLSGTCMINVGLAEETPQDERPLCVMARVPMHAPGEDGRGEQGERDELSAIEDELFERVLGECDAVHVATVRGAGRLDYWFYAPTGGEDGVLAALAEGFEGYEVAGASQEDAEWSQYTDVLYPDAKAWREIGNLEVIEAMIDAGDPLVIPRPIEHLALFPDEASARRFATVIEAEGFTVPLIERSEDLDPPWEVEAVRDGPVTLDEITDVTEWLQETAEEHGGQYDGWQAAVLSESGSPRPPD